MKAVVWIDGVDRWYVVELAVSDGGDTKVRFWWNQDTKWENYRNKATEYLAEFHAMHGMRSAHSTEVKNAFECASNKTSPTQSGWSCPRCSRIYGPSVQICVPCNTAVAAKEAK